MWGARARAARCRSPADPPPPLIAGDRRLAPGEPGEAVQIVRAAESEGRDRVEEARPRSARQQLQVIELGASLLPGDLAQQRQRVDDPREPQGAGVVWVEPEVEDEAGDRLPGARAVAGDEHARRRAH